MGNAAQKSGLDMSKPQDKNYYFERFINVPIIRTGRKLQNMFYREALQPEGISLQEWRVLLNLDGMGDTHLRELARVGHLDPTHTSRTVRALERRGLLTRYADQKDNRRTRLKTTQEGHELIARIWPIALELDAHIKSHIGPAQYQLLQDACLAVLDVPEFKPGAKRAWVAE